MEQGNVTEIVVGALSFPHSYIYKDMRYTEYNVCKLWDNSEFVLRMQNKGSGC